MEEEIKDNLENKSIQKQYARIEEIPIEEVKDFYHDINLNEVEDENILG